MRKRILLLLLMVLAVGCSRERGGELDRLLAHRPDNHRLVQDFTGVLADVRSSVERHLAAIRDRYKIEIVVVVLPSLESRYTVSRAAVDLFSNWRIGAACQGRGILLLLVDDLKAVKIEVGMDLEDVFTDLFTGYIEDSQLQPHYAHGRLDIGMIAVLEEIEARSHFKYQGGYSRRSVAQLDARYLSQGAGARHRLETQPDRSPAAGPVNRGYPAGRSPEAAWQTMIRHWGENVRDPFLGVYTPLTRLAYRDFTHQTDSRFEAEFRRYAGKGYEVRQAGDYAVIYFGRLKGWENSPFLFCRTEAGWQFDIVRQRRYVRMGPAPGWGIEFSEHPYMGLLKDAFSYSGQDIPLQDEDRYTTARDAAWAGRIQQLEALHHEKPEDLEAAIALGRLYTLVSMSRKAIPLLKLVQRRAPEDPRPYKYLAIAFVNAFYQYDTALKMLKTYTDLAPGDPFGYNFRGYLHYCRKAYQPAVDALEKALQPEADNCYAHFYLTCAYAGLYQQAPADTSRRSRYRERFAHHRRQARSYEASHPLRVDRLNRLYPGKD